MRLFGGLLTIVFLFFVFDLGSSFSEAGKKLSLTLFDQPDLPSVQMVESRFAVRVPRPVYDYAADPRDYNQYSFDFDGQTIRWLGFGVENEDGLGDFVGQQRSLIILLHGSDLNGASMIDQWDHVAKHSLIVAPYFGTMVGWSAKSDSSKLITELLIEVAKVANVDSGRIFLFGYQDGAVHAQRLANSMRDTWRAVATFGGALDENEVVPAKDATPIKLYLGGEDASLSINTARITARKLAQAGHPTEVIMLPGATHWYYGLATELNTEVLRWFRSLN